MARNIKNIEEIFANSKYPVKHVGANLNSDATIVILLHGRRQKMDDMLKIIQKINLPKISYLIPQAPSSTWYPRGFMRDIGDNQPSLDEALTSINGLINYLTFNEVKKSNIWIMGFSQGACIAAELLSQYQHNLAGAIMFTGGLFGPSDPNPEYVSNVFCGMKILLSGSQTDSWVPAERVSATASYFEKLGANVHLRIFPEREHYISRPEIEQAVELITSQLCIDEKDVICE